MSGRGVRLELAPEVFDDFDRFFEHMAKFEVADGPRRFEEIIQSLQILTLSPLIGRPVKGGNANWSSGTHRAGTSRYIDLWSLSTPFSFLPYAASASEASNDGRRRVCSRQAECWARWPGDCRKLKASPDRFNIRHIVFLARNGGISIRKARQELTRHRYAVVKCWTVGERGNCLEPSNQARPGQFKLRKEGFPVAQKECGCTPQLLRLSLDDQREIEQVTQWRGRPGDTASSR